MSLGISMLCLKYNIPQPDGLILSYPAVNLSYQFTPSILGSFTDIIVPFPFLVKNDDPTSAQEHPVAAVKERLQAGGPLRSDPLIILSLSLVLIYSAVVHPIPVSCSRIYPTHCQ